jgi:hypothetical protein
LFFVGNGVARIGFFMRLALASTENPRKINCEGGDAGVTVSQTGSQGCRAKN